LSGGVCTDGAEPQTAATALLGLWQIQFQGLKKYLDDSRTPTQVREAVTVGARSAQSSSPAKPQGYI
jgi:hypothetical protein